MPYKPAPTILTSGTGTGNIQSVRRPLDIGNDVLFYNPNATPFTLLAQKSDTKSVIDPEFKTLEAQVQPYIDRINNSGGYSAVATSVVVDNGSYFKSKRPRTRYEDE